MASRSGRREMSRPFSAVARTLRPGRRTRNLLLEALEDRTLPTLLGQSLFPADNAWNQNIANAPVAANSTAIINHIIAVQKSDGNTHPDFGQDSRSSNVLYGIPYNVVHGNSTARIHVVIDAYPGESDLQNAPVPANAVIEGDFQNGPMPGLGNRGDSHMIIFDEDNDVAYEFYHASRPSENSDGQWHADQETVWNMKTDQFRTLGFTSADAAGLSILAGLIRPDEGLPVSQGGQGVINHAIRFTLQNSIILDQYIYPASHEANSNTNPAIDPPMGTRFRLKSSVDISTLNPESQIVARAMQQYGLILADSGSNFYFSGASFSENASGQFALTWDDNDIQDTVHGLKSLKFSDFEVVNLAPVVTGLSTHTGPAGTTVTVTGQNFSGAAGHLQVLFGGVPGGSVNILDDGHVTAIAPAGTGAVNVQVQSGVTTTADASENFTSPIFGYGISATSSSDQFTYTAAAPATHFSVSAPGSAAAGSAFNFTLTALDASNATAVAYTGTVHFTSTDPNAVLPADYTFQPGDFGVHTFSVTLETAGSMSVTVADAANNLGPLGTAIGVTPGAASLSRSTVSVMPTSLRAGTTTTVTLTAADAFGNQETAGGLSVSFGLNGTAGGSFGPVTDNKNGTYTATLTATAPGSSKVTATIGGHAVTSVLPTVTVTPDAPPVIQPIGDVTLPHGQFPAKVTVQASSPVGNPLTLSATATADSLLYDLQSQYRFTAVGRQTAGATAYVLHSGQPGPGVMGYYLIRPSDGALFAYDGSASYATTFANGTPLATLGANVYADPALLLAAQPPVNYPALYALEQQYRFQPMGLRATSDGVAAYVFQSAQPGPGVGGYYLLRADGALFAYDGSATYGQTFARNAPLAGLGAGVYANPSLLLNAQATPGLYPQLAQVMQRYALQAVGYQFAGATAYVLTSAAGNNASGNPYYLLRSDGALFAYDGSGSYAHTFQNGTPLADLTAAVFATPSLLLDATAPEAATGLTATLSGGTLTLNAPASFVGTVRVTVTASDGILTTAQSFRVTSTDTAPLPAAVPPQAASRSGSPLQVALGAADAEGDPVTFSAQAVGSSAAYNLQQIYHFTGGTRMTTADGVTAVVLKSGVPGGVGGYYLISAGGGVYAYDGASAYGLTFGNAKNLVAQLDPSVFANPTLLTSAQAPAALPSGVVGVSGNTLSVNVSALPVGTVFQILVTASDGAETGQTSFVVTVTA